MGNLSIFIYLFTPRSIKTASIMSHAILETGGRAVKRWTESLPFEVYILVLGTNSKQMNK